MKKSELKMMVRKIVREEVAMAIQEVITELKEPTVVEKTTVQKPKKKKIVEKQFTSNKVLNSVLNETANSDWETMGGGIQTTENMNNILQNQYGNMMNGGQTNATPQTDIEGRPITQLPDHLQNAFTKDYSKLIKKVDEKAQKSRGV